MSKICRIETNARMSRIVIHNGVAHLCGQVADDWSLDIDGQTHQVLDKIDKLLIKIGCERRDLLTAQIYLKNISRDFARMNAIWDNWTIPETAPTRATVQAEMAAPDVLIEIIISAAVAQ